MSDEICFGNQAQQFAEIETAIEVASTFNGVSGLGVGAIRAYLVKNLRDEDWFCSPYLSVPFMRTLALTIYRTSRRGVLKSVK
jgi:hypothetical protein